MKHFFVFVIAICTVNFLNAQINFSGKIVNEKQEPLSNATVIIKSIGAKEKQQTLSNENGYFSFPAIKNNTHWKLDIFYTGKNIYEKEIVANTSNTDAVYVLADNGNELEPLEVTAIRASEKSPFTKTTISQADISKNNLGKDLPFLLDQTPSVVVNSDAGNGVGYTGITIRGTDATRTNVTINGIPYNDAEAQNVYFVDIPDIASSAGSIQIQRGVGSSTNGAGAFGATINISTNEVRDSAYAQINNSYGSFNTWKNMVATGSGLIDGKFTADVRLSNISSNGYIDRAKSNLQSLLFSTAYIGKKTTVRFNFITGKEKTYQAWDGVPQDSILAGNRTYNELGFIKKEANGADSFYSNQTDNYRQSHYQLFITHRFNERWSFNLTSFLTHGYGYYEEYRVNQPYSNYGININGSTDLIDRQILSNNFYGETFSLQYKNINDELTFGGAWTNYDGQHYGTVIWAQNGGIPDDYEYYNTPAYKYDKSVYVKWLHTFSKYWNVYADMQYRNDWYHIYGFDDMPDTTVKNNFNFLNPKVGISYTRNGYNAYLSYALANKEPNRDDYESNAAKPEKLNDFELGIEKKSMRYSWGINFYYMLYKDQLVLTGMLNDVGDAIRMNVPNSYRAGIEMQGGYVFAKWLDAAANLTLSRNKIKSFTGYYNAYDADGNALPQVAQPYKNTDIAYSPNIISSATVDIFPVKNLEFSLIGKYVGRRYMDNSQTMSRSIPSYYNQDARLIYTIKNNFFKELNIIATAYNVFNKKYFSNGFTYPEFDNGVLNNYNYFFPMAGTNYMLGVNVKL